MIYWKDFILDDVIGPVLAIPADVNAESDEGTQLGRSKRLGRRSIMDDANSAIIQETRTDQRPARMASHSTLDSVEAGMDAGVGARAKVLLTTIRGE